MGTEIGFGRKLIFAIFVYHFICYEVTPNVSYFRQVATNQQRLKNKAKLLVSFLIKIKLPR